MDNTIRLLDPNKKLREIPADSKPGECPRCHRFGDVTVLAAVKGGAKLSARHDALAVCQCGHPSCETLFSATYALTVDNGIERAGLMRHTPLNYAPPSEFSDSILRLSPTFCETYDQAVRAQENDLSQICGAGYRRALEFLIKDFAISRVADTNAELRNKIARTLLGQCIRDYLPAGPIQDAAKRAAWLGNDETHYYRLWADQDITDLKALIYLTMKWIDFTLEVEHYVSTMPDK